MTRDELVERMARAICHAEQPDDSCAGYGLPSGCIPKHNGKECYYLAKAAAALTELEKHAVVTSRAGPVK